MEVANVQAAEGVKAVFNAEISGPSSAPSSYMDRASPITVRKHYLNCSKLTFFFSGSHNENKNVYLHKISCTHSNDLAFP
jgi:hypothetical protein